MGKFSSYMKEHKYLYFVLFVPAYLISFFILESIEFSSYSAMWCPLDDLIPFCEYFIIPYCLWYPMLVAVGLALMFTNLPSFRRYMWFLIITFAASFIICLVYPNMQELRPSEFARDNFFVSVIRSLYESDTNTNVLPSVHCLGSLAVLYSAWEAPTFKRWWVRLILTVLPLSICASTVLIKQHSILDFFASLAIAIIVVVVFSIIKRKNPEFKPRKQ